ncbi:MAG: hypothetical protein Crog4KO_07970 [Crocinitomicaceae bacterium]
MKNVLAIISVLTAGLSFGQTLNETQGTGAGVSITSGDFNVIYGDSAGTNLTTGHGHIFIGTGAGYNQTNGGFSSWHYDGGSASSNVFIGQASGFSSTTSIDNVFIGAHAGYYNDSGSDNVFIGTETGRNNTTGDDNVFIGEEAGRYNTTGEENVFIGEDAGTKNLSGSDNTFVGRWAGSENTTGYQNTFVGHHAGYDNTTGYWNVAVGDSAGVDVSNGYANTYIGHAAGAADEFGYHNTFVGNNAGWENGRTNNQGDGINNTYLGSNAGHSNRGGNYNVVIGAQADYGSVGSTSGNHFNVLMGYQARLNGAPSYAIGIGPYCEANDDHAYAFGFDADADGEYSIGFGYNADVPNDNAISFGHNAINAGTRTTLIGLSTNGSANDATTLGYQTSAAEFSTSLGSTASATGQYSTAIGYGANTVDSNVMVLGGATATDRVSVGIGTSSPNQNASLTLDDTDKGFLMNRLTTTLRTSLGSTIGASEQGLMVYDTDENAIYTWDGTAWNAAGTDTDDQTLSLSGTNLSIADGNTVDLSSLDTDTQLTEAEVDTYVANNGYLTSFTEVDGDATNEIQDISLAGSDLTISSGSTIDLSVIDTDTQLTEAEVDSYVANNGYLTSFTEVDGDATNEIQDISLAGSDLTISSGSTIDLSVIDTDTQLDSTGVAALGFVAGPHTVDTDTQLSEAEVDAYVANNGYLTSFTEVDGDATNEIQDISLAGSDLTISSGSTIDLSVIDTDTQLDSSGVAALGFVAGPHTVDTDDQNLSEVLTQGNDGGAIQIKNIQDPTDPQDAATKAYVDLLESTVNNMQNQINNLQNQLTNVQTQVNDHETRILYLEDCACDSTAGLWDGGTSGENAILYQNIPNPFNGTSTIKYYIPTWANSANLVFSNEIGQVISNIELNEVGAYGSANINAADLAPATYFYTLYINQTAVETKKMIVQ